MPDIAVLSPNTTVQVLRPHGAENDARFRRRMEAMVCALDACAPDTTAVILIEPSGGPICVVTHMPPARNS